METFELKGELRSSVGKKSSKELRTNESVPCVLYGGGENVHFSLPERTLNKVLYTPLVYKLRIDVGGKVYDAIVRDVQFHPVTDRTLHADFYQIYEDKPVTMEIPVKLNGFSAGVQAGGRLVLIIRKLKINALPKDLPAQVDIDVTELGLGKSIKVKDLAFDNFEIVNAKDAVVVQVKMTRAAKAAEAAQGK